MLISSNISNILSPSFSFISIPSCPPQLHLSFTVCQGDSGTHTAICLASFSLLLLFLVIPLSGVSNLIPSLGEFLVVFCLCASKSHHIFFLTSSIPQWDSWKYVLNPNIKDSVHKGITTSSSFRRRKSISFENLSIGKKYKQPTAPSQNSLSENTLQKRNYGYHWPTEGIRHKMLM